MSNDGQGGEPADYTVMWGTSMSSPAAAGAAAVILSALDNSPSPSEFRDLLFSHTLHDEYTGDVPNNTWGWGKLDVIRTLGIPEKGFAKLLLPGDLSLGTVYPNPFNSELSIQYSLNGSGELALEVFDLSGRLVTSCIYHDINQGQHNGEVHLNMADISSGTYLVRVSYGGSDLSMPVVLIK